MYKRFDIYICKYTCIYVCKSPAKNAFSGFVFMDACIYTYFIDSSEFVCIYIHTGKQCVCLHIYIYIYIYVFKMYAYM